MTDQQGIEGFFKRELVPQSIQDLDAADGLAHKKNEFYLAENQFYFDGNSLGPLPTAARSRVSACLDEEWGKDLIKSWNSHSWIDLPVATGEKIAPLIGAAPGQLICCDSISVNLFKVLSCALALNPERDVILTQSANFPTDLYVTEGLTSLLTSLDSSAQRHKVICVDNNEIINSLNNDIAVVMLTEVDFRSGEKLDMASITAAAHKVGALVIWDLAHSAGAFPVYLDDCNVDFAVGCGYKYLNGGPGAPAFIYAAKRHQDKCQQPLSGWMGHANPFDFSPSYQPAPGIKRFLSGTPNILSLTALDGALDVFTNVCMRAVRSKSLAMSELFIGLKNTSASLGELKLVTPAEPALRGSQLAWSHDSAFEITQALIEQGVIVDFREPNILRFGFAPLYQSYADVWHAVTILQQIMSSQLYKEPRFSIRERVT